MTDIDKQVDEILALDEKRTQGEWEFWGGSCDDSEGIFESVITNSPRKDIVYNEPNVPEDDRHYDFIFIAKAPQMVSIIKQLKEQRDALREDVRDLGEMSDTCTFGRLREICNGCRCEKKPKEEK